MKKIGRLGPFIFVGALFILGLVIVPKSLWVNWQFPGLFLAFFNTLILTLAILLGMSIFSERGKNRARKLYQLQYILFLIFYIVYFIDFGNPGSWGLWVIYIFGPGLIVATTINILLFTAACIFESRRSVQGERKMPPTNR